MDGLNSEVWTLFVDVMKWSLTVAFFVLMYGCVYVTVLYRAGRKEMREQVAKKHDVKIYHFPKSQRGHR